jgi:hypothetical protein
MTTEAPTATRTTPLPVRLDAASGQILLYVGDRKVASAWGPAVDDRDAWFFWNGHTEPYRISGGRDAAAALMEDRRREWANREGSLRRPDHGPVDEHGYVARVPDGTICGGCGDPLARDVTFGTYRHGGEVTEHYLCDPCACYCEDAE